MRSNTIILVKGKKTIIIEIKQSWKNLLAFEYDLKSNSNKRIFHCEKTPTLARLLMRLYKRKFIDYPCQLVR